MDACSSNFLIHDSIGKFDGFHAEILKDTIQGDDVEPYGKLPYGFIVDLMRVLKMQSYRDATRAVDEPRSARMEQRTKPHVKAEIQRAAALLGVDETAFVTSAAYERARSTINDHESTVLTNEDRAVFLAALDAPAQPTEALREAVTMHRRLVRDGK